jgi:hypothetical protein
MELRLTRNAPIFTVLLEESMTSSQRPTPEALAAYPEIVLLDKTSVILRITLALNARSDRRWRVHGGTGFDRGRLIITAPADRLDASGGMGEADRVELGRLLGLPEPTDPEGVGVVETYADYIHAIDLAEGRIPRVEPEIYPWDEPSRPGARLLGRRERIGGEDGTACEPR